MFRTLLLGLLAVIPTLLTAQLTLHITELPSNTPNDAVLYAAGSFNGWNAGDPAFSFTGENDGTYTLTFSPPTGTLEFKCTRGAWTAVEGNAEGNYRPNRIVNYDGTPQTVELEILSWEDLAGGGSTATENVSIVSTDFYMPQLDRNRRIWIYLPPDYTTTTKTYPVLYMQDGQNLFDATTSFSGEWEVDESLNQLFEDGDEGVIVVGIDNGGAARIDEYSPWVNAQYGGGEGEAYTNFIVETLKPFIDDNYRTKPDRANTGIAGSSLGGLISMYAAIEHQEVFSKAGIFSPAFWFAPECYAHVSSTGKEADMRIYFVAGEQESATMIPNMTAMYNTCLNAGFDESELLILSHPDGQHSEWYWNREFPDAYEWLFDQTTSTLSAPLLSPVRLTPNPADYILKISTEHPLIQPTIQIYSVNGQLIKPPTILQGNTFNVSFLSEGVYVFNVLDGNTLIGSQQIIISR
jgi:predicted alpha/beta superfamily hydrolase